MRRVIFYGAVISALSLGAYFIGLYVYESAAVAMTMTFAVVSLSQLAHAVNQRSDTESVFARGNGHNPALYAMIGASLLIVLLVMFVPFLREFFSLTLLSPQQYLIVLGFSLAPIAVSEISKCFLRAAERKKTR